MKKKQLSAPGRFGLHRTQFVAYAILIVLLSVGLMACGESPISPTVPEAHGAESGNESGSEGSSGSGEPGESGTRYGLADTATEIRSGVNLVMRYDAAAQSFTGTVTNTTAAAVADVRVEIHLSNGIELGPTPRVTLNAGEAQPVVLAANGQNFTGWSVHVEIGSGSN